MSDELDEIQAIFFEECAEGLAAAEAGLSEMDAGNASAETIAGVFRAVHSIKGGAGAFGHADLTAFAHRFENVLDEVRAGRIEPTADVCRVLLMSFDVLSDHVAAAQGQAASPSDQAALDALELLLSQKDTPAAEAETAVVAAPAVEVAPAEEDEFGFVPVVADIPDFDFDLPDLSVEGGSDQPETGAWTIHFKPGAGDLANGSEPLLLLRELDRLGGKVIAVDTTALPSLDEIDPAKSYFGWTMSAPGEIPEDELREIFDFVSPNATVRIERGETPPEPSGSDLPPEPAPAEDAEQPAAEEAAAPKPAPAARAAADTASQTIRVDLGKLDMLLNLVGELVIHGSILADRLSPADQQKVELSQLARLTREIQDNVMSLRAQPIRQAFSRVPRLMRDLEAETGKRVNLVVTGETTEVDKSVIEKIGDPLTHLVRNAVDHGIENTETRVAAGKEPEGTIHLSAEQKGARIIVRISDDGGGIDRARVLQKAIDKEIVPVGAELSNEEIDQLICAPGFSTAETISNVSGRGVGMDVVRSNVEALGGRVEIQSAPGEGTTFTMVLPLSLAILDGMIVRMAGQRFVLPLSSVIEAVQPEPGQVKATSPDTEVIEMRGIYRPIKRLNRLFRMPANDERAVDDSLVIIVETEAAGPVGLMVDTIDDRREVVLKSLDHDLNSVPGIGGATVLGDGTIALVLDIEALVAPAPGAASKHSAKGMAA